MNTKLLIVVLLGFVLSVLTFAGGTEQADNCKPKDPCAVPKRPVVRRAPVSHPVVSKPVNDNDNEQDQGQEQKQHQTVNVYNTAPVQQSERRVIIERSVLHHKYNNRIGFLLGVGPRDCCVLNNNRVLVGGAYYERRIVGPFNLGVGALTNRTFFGMIGIDF